MTIWLFGLLVTYILISFWETASHLKYRRRMEMQQDDMERMLSDIHRHIVISDK